MSEELNLILGMLEFLIFFLLEFHFNICVNRAAFDLAPRKFIQQFRPRMNEIKAEARARIREIKKAKNEAKKQRKLAQQNDNFKYGEEEEEFPDDDQME